MLDADLREIERHLTLEDWPGIVRYRQECLRAGRPELAGFWPGDIVMVAAHSFVVPAGLGVVLPPRQNMHPLNGTKLATGYGPCYHRDLWTLVAVATQKFPKIHDLDGSVVLEVDGIPGHRFWKI